MPCTQLITNEFANYTVQARNNPRWIMMGLIHTANSIIKGEALQSHDNVPHVIFRDSLLTKKTKTYVPFSNALHLCYHHILDRKQTYVVCKFLNNYGVKGLNEYKNKITIIYHHHLVTNTNGGWRYWSKLSMSTTCVWGLSVKKQ